MNCLLILECLHFVTIYHNITTFYAQAIDSFQQDITDRFSSSMQNNNAIGKLNSAIAAFIEQCLKDDALRWGLDIAVVKFASEVKILQEFTPVTEMITPVLEANGENLKQ